MQWSKEVYSFIEVFGIEKRWTESQNVLILSNYGLKEVHIQVQLQQYTIYCEEK